MLKLALKLQELRLAITVDVSILLSYTGIYLFPSLPLPTHVTGMWDTSRTGMARVLPLHAAQHKICCMCPKNLRLPLFGANCSWPGIYSWPGCGGPTVDLQLAWRHLWMARHLQLARASCGP